MINRTACNWGLDRLIRKAHDACSWPAPAVFATRFDLGASGFLTASSTTNQTLFANLRVLRGAPDSALRRRATEPLFRSC
jgi:hypothetical protein